MQFIEEKLEIDETTGNVTQGKKVVKVMKISRMKSLNSIQSTPSPTEGYLHSNQTRSD